MGKSRWARVNGWVQKEGAKPKGISHQVFDGTYVIETLQLIPLTEMNLEILRKEYEIEVQSDIKVLGENKFYSNLPNFRCPHCNQVEKSSSISYPIDRTNRKVTRGVCVDCYDHSMYGIPVRRYRLPTKTELRELLHVPDAIGEPAATLLHVAFKD